LYKDETEIKIKC